MIPRRCRSFLVIAFALIASTALAQSSPLLEPISGALVLHGGGPVSDAVRQRFIELAGGPKARLVIVPGKAENADPLKALDLWTKLPVASATVLDHSQADPLANATGVWFDEGVSVIGDPAVRRELHKVLARGGVIGGTGAGAAMLGASVTRAEGKAASNQNLNLLAGIVIDTRFLKRNEPEHLLKKLSRQPELAGIGIDEGATAIIHGRSLSVIGSSYVVTCLAPRAPRPAGLHVLHEGDRADVVALARSALARSQPPFPPKDPPAPTVPNGTLIISGGGGLPDTVWQRFIDAAGGAEATIVVIPTAYGDKPPAVPGEARKLKAMGMKNVIVLHAHNRAEADSSKFVESLKQAKGIWFTGGRQWHLVDAYENTRAAKEFHALLARGGVIGGSSAGASIQADYMCRGDPLGNLNIIAEGYEHGLGFVPGVAIDQHFFRRNRTKDMTGLMAAYPQLLGIGLDEGTAIVVRGSTMEVIGRSKVAVYNRRKPIPNGGLDYETLLPGTRYDMKARAIIPN